MTNLIQTPVKIIFKFKTILNARVNKELRPIIFYLILTLNLFTLKRNIQEHITYKQIGITHMRNRVSTPSPCSVGRNTALSKCVFVHV